MAPRVGMGKGQDAEHRGGHDVVCRVFALVGNDQSRQLRGVRHALVRTFDAPSTNLADSGVLCRNGNLEPALHHGIAERMRLRRLGCVDRPGHGGENDGEPEHGSNEKEHAGGPLPEGHVSDCAILGIDRETSPQFRRAYLYGLIHPSVTMIRGRACQPLNPPAA